MTNKYIVIMDYEKKYKEALERAKEKYTKCYSPTLLDYIFPELKESKDNRIMKVIRGWIYTRPASFFDNGISKEEILAWLEKQGEQESIDPDTLIQQRVDALADIVAEQNFTDELEPKAEYTRTDAFIEKACEKLKKCMYDNLMFQGRLHRKDVIETFVEKFKKYMEE